MNELVSAQMNESYLNEFWACFTFRSMKQKVTSKWTFPSFFIQPRGQFSFLNFFLIENSK